MKKFNILFSKFLIISISLFFINLLFNGCYSLREVNIENNESTKIYEIETLDGNVIDFQDSKLGYAVLTDNEVISYKPDGTQKVFPMSNVRKYYTEKFNTEETVLLVAGCVAALSLIAVVLVSSKLSHIGSGISFSIVDFTLGNNF